MKTQIATKRYASIDKERQGAPRQTYLRCRQRTFDCPGGYVNSGEAPQKAVKREYLEETGISVEPKNIIGVLERWIVDEMKIPKEEIAQMLNVILTKINLG